MRIESCIFLIAGSQSSQVDWRGQGEGAPPRSLPSHRIPSQMETSCPWNLTPSSRTQGKLSISVTTMLLPCKQPQRETAYAEDVAGAASRKQGLILHHSVQKSGVESTGQEQEDLIL